jgi:xylan 1,4-beta-xylosidase
MTPLPPLKHAWRECICVGRAAEILGAPVQAQLRALQKEIGYRHIRFHASFHDELGVVAANPDGSVRYRWALVDQIYDFLVEVGFDPIVELNPMPKALASGEKTFFDFKMNITPPTSWQAWEDLCAATAAHFVERHGLERVKGWLFEVWNEPNLNGQFWTGSIEDYYQLYAASARGIKRVHPELRVGGPSSAGTAMALPFARWCREQGVPLDFLTTHFYPMAEYGAHPRREGSPHAPGQAFIAEFRDCRAALDADGFAHLPNVVTEWNTLHCSPEGKAKWVGVSDTTRLFSAAAALHYAVGADPHVAALGYWTANDSMQEAGVTSEPFGTRNQYYGLFTIDGLPKPAYHAFKYLSRMGGSRLPLVPESRPACAGGLVTDETVTTRALLWNFHEPLSSAESWRGELELPVPAALGVGAGEVFVVTATLTAGAGSPYETWQAMGSPVTLTRLEQEAVAAASQPRHHVLRLAVKEGKVRLPFLLKRDEVLFAELCPARVGSCATSADADAALAALDHALQYPGAV